ncbi:early set domain-containing protein [Desulfocastanea catecholica]
MKSIHVAFVLFCLVLPSCSSHFYKMNGREVTLYLDTPAESVEFFCSLNSYAGQALTQRKGVWQVTVPADKPFRYFYKVDGENFLPVCPKTEKDDFGSENCIFEPRL